MADRFCKMSRHGAIEGKAVTTRAAQKQSGDGEREKVMEGGGRSCTYGGPSLGARLPFASLPPLEGSSGGEVIVRERLRNRS